jgi:hypothetical protein
MTAHISLILGRTRGHRPRLQRIRHYLDRLLSKEGKQRNGGVVQSRAATLLMLVKRSLFIGTFVFEQTAPALAARGHPRLTKAGNRQSWL